MTIVELRDFFLWCTVINVVGLMWWFFIITLRHDWVYRIHTKMFKISVETFDSIHYGGMMAYKVAIFIFNLIPYLALLIIGTEAGIPPT